MKNNKQILLNEIGNKIPFTVPDNYFEHFAMQMESQLNVTTAPVKRILKPWMYMAAAFIGVLFLSRVAFTAYSGNNDKNVENYEMYMISQLDESVIYDYYVNEENSK